MGVKGRGCGPSGGGLLQSSNPLTNPSRHRSGAHPLKENGISLKGKQFLHALFIFFVKSSIALLSNNIMLVIKMFKHFQLIIIQI